MGDPMNHDGGDDEAGVDELIDDGEAMCDGEAAADHARERRTEPRYPGHAFPGVATVRVRPGIQASLVDMSATGAQLETARRLLQGRFVHVQFLSHGTVTTVRARVVRNHVGTLSACLIRYRAGVRFDRRVSWNAPGERVQAGVDPA